MKVCTKCTKEKPKSCFYQRSDGKLVSRCKDCFKVYYESNKFSRLQYANSYRKENKDSIAHYQKRYKQENADNQRHYYRRYKKDRYANDLDFRIRCILRARIRNAIKKGRAGSAVKDLGCSVQELKQHIESKFRTGMSWKNFGEWEIDHIIPLSSFDLSKRKEFLKAAHYTNLQPLWRKENCSKRNFVLDKL